MHQGQPLLNQNKGEDQLQGDLSSLGLDTGGAFLKNFANNCKSFAPNIRLIIAIVALFFSSFATLAQNNCTPAPSGLISWWPADGFALDVASTNNGVLQGGATYAAGEVGQAFSFDGTNGFVSTSLIVTNPQTFTLSLWFKSSTTRGGVLLSFGDSQTGTPANYDRHIYMDNAGALHFGVNSSGTKVISSTNGLNNNSWHYVATVLSTNAGMSLYLDGGLVATNVAVTNAQSFNGWWRIGENNLANWPSLPSSYFFNGQIDEVSIFNRALASNEIAAVYQAGNSGMCYTNTPVPVFVQNPLSQTDYVANAFSLTGAAMGTPRPQYKWLTNGVPLIGATNTFLVFSNPTTNQSGLYSLVASNVFGSTTSSVANISIIIPGFLIGTESFESGFDGWTTSNTNIWQIGKPTNGPGKAYDGTNCAGTGLTNGPPASQSSRLSSPAFVVPAANQNPRLRWWQWFVFGSDYNGTDDGQLQISTNNGTSWQTLATYTGNSAGWSEPSVDLSAYAGQTVQVGFFFTSGDHYYGSSPGWFVDDVTLVTGAITTLTANVPYGFESGLGDWSVNNGVWAIGVPTNGPGKAYDGTNCAGTGLTNGPPASQSSRLSSPAFVVPAANQNPRLRWWQWFVFGSDYNGTDDGQLQISTNNGTSWQTLATYTGNSAGWSEPSVDLSAYAGQTVQVGFFFTSGDHYYGSSPGWFVDDVTLVTGAGLQLVLLMPISSPQIGGTIFSSASLQVQDQGTTVVNWASPITATAYSGGGSLHGTTSLNANFATGSATFTNLYYSLANSNVAQSVTFVFNSSFLAPVTNPAVAIDFPISEFSVSSSNSQVLIDPTSDAGLNSWTVNGADVSYQHWYWLRIGSNTPQFSLEHSIQTVWLESVANQHYRQLPWARIKCNHCVFSQRR